jgi:hypothetical protein
MKKERAEFRSRKLGAKSRKKKIDRRKMRLDKIRLREGFIKIKTRVFGVRDRVCKWPWFKAFGPIELLCQFARLRYDLL